VLYSENLITDGNAMFAQACKLNWEGMVSKNADSPYRSDRNEGLRRAMRCLVPDHRTAPHEIPDSSLVPKASK
jgi:hypothetical protein